MNTRRASPCLRVIRQQLRATRQIKSPGSLQQRFASTSSQPAAGPASSTASQIGLITSELDKLSPRFDVSAESIEILRSPAEFYETLKAWNLISSCYAVADRLAK